MKGAWETQSGFSMIESMLAISMLTLGALAIGSMSLNQTRTSMNLKFQQEAAGKASALRTYLETPACSSLWSNQSVPVANQEISMVGLDGVVFQTGQSTGSSGKITSFRVGSITTVPGSPNLYLISLRLDMAANSGSGSGTQQSYAFSSVVAGNPLNTSVLQTCIFGASLGAN